MIKQLMLAIGLITIIALTGCTSMPPPTVLEGLFVHNDTIVFDEGLLLTKNLIKIAPLSNPPSNCDTNLTGAMYYDNEENNYCVCTSTGWKKIENISVTCT